MSIAVLGTGTFRIKTPYLLNVYIYLIDFLKSILLRLTEVTIIIRFLCGTWMIKVVIQFNS